eukprot:6460007-Amphidinium_carterae.1
MYVANRRGQEICRGFQDGSCALTVQGNRCSVDPTRVHQCSKCLSTDHGAVDCKSTKDPSASSPSQPPGVLRKKGGGKGHARKN